MDRRAFLRRGGLVAAGAFAGGAAVGVGTAAGAETYHVDEDVSRSGHAVGAARPAHLSGTSIIYRVQTDAPRVALTFDDGPSTRYTARILDILDAKKAAATFFEIGEHIASYPDLSRRAATSHEIGNHTWSHPNMSLATAAIARDELSRGAAEIERTTGRSPRLFRPPFGYFSGATAMIAASYNYPVVLWTDKFNVGDSMSSNLARLTEATRSGDIILGHDGGTLDNDVVVATLPSLIDSLRRRGFQLVTVADLLVSPRAIGAGNFVST